MSKTAYLAGPMSGIEDWNKPAFNAAAQALRDEGWDVFNPAADGDTELGKPLAHYMVQDLAEVAKRDAVMLLHGWERSKGATIEALVAVALGKKIRREPFLEPSTFGPSHIIMASRTPTPNDILAAFIRCHFAGWVASLGMKALGLGGVE